MRRLQDNIPELSHMRHIVQADTRVFVTNTAVTQESNIVYLIPPKRQAEKRRTEKEQATIDNIIFLSDHI